MDAPIFYKYVANCFYPWLVENSIKFPVLFLLDGHKTHINLKISNFDFINKFCPSAFYPHATNAFQSCDISIFLLLKRFMETRN